MKLKKNNGRSFIITNDVRELYLFYTYKNVGLHVLIYFPQFEEEIKKYALHAMKPQSSRG